MCTSSEGPLWIDDLDVVTVCMCVYVCVDCVDRLESFDTEISAIHVSCVSRRSVQNECMWT